MIGLVIFIVLLATIFGYFRLQFRSLRDWTGAFRAVAAAPLLVWVAWLAMLVRDLARDPTDHNLFPFEMAFIAVAGFAFLIVLAGIRTAAGALSDRG